METSKMKNSSKILIAIPCFNEGKNIIKVVEKLINDFPMNQICVINDGSTDDTLLKAKSVLRAQDFLIDFEMNKGIADAIRGASELAINENFLGMIQVDGDNQHPVDSVRALLEKSVELIEIGLNDFVVIGSRYADKGYRTGSTILRKIGNQTISKIINLLYRSNLSTDPTSGLRIHCGHALTLLRDQYPAKWPEPIFLARLISNKVAIFEVPVHMDERTQGVSSIQGFNSLYFMFYTCWHILVDRIKA